jgi:hypothetical protein
LPLPLHALRRVLGVAHSVPVAFAKHAQSPALVHAPPFWHLHAAQSPPASASASPPYPGRHTLP